MTFTPLKIQPYTAEEVFYSFDGEGFNQQRLYGGVFIPLHEKVRLELFYIWKLDKAGRRLARHQRPRLLGVLPVLTHR